jgi:hypothetical protein
MRVLQLPAKPVQAFGELLKFVSLLPLPFFVCLFPNGTGLCWGAREQRDHRSNYRERG